MGLAACGGGDDGGSTQPAATGGTETAAAAPGVAEAQQRIDSLYAGESFADPPATSPPPQTGKNVWHVSVGLAIPASVLFSDAVKDSAKALGWNLRVYDAKFSPDQFQQGIRQAIADKADGIILYNIDCVLAQSAMKQAKQAGIAIIGGESLDCNESDPNGPSYFAGGIVYNDIPTFTEVAKTLGAVNADWIIAKTEGKAKTIVFSQKDIQTAASIDVGFREQFKKCTGCKIVRTVRIDTSDPGTKLQQKAEQALLQTPDADSMMVPYDDLMTAGIAAAVQGSGRKDELQVIAGGGYEPNMDLIRKNEGQDAGYDISIPWEGYAAADTLNRVFAGEEPANSGIGIGLFDTDHNLGTSGPSKVPIDFAGLYKKAWAAAAGG